MGRAHTPAASKSSAVPTQVSTTTPDKALKKLRVFDSKQDLHEKRALSFDSQEPEATYEGEKKALPEPKAAIPSPGEQEGHSPGLGQTGEAPEMSEEVANLRELYHKTLTEKAELENMVQKLEQQIHSLTFHDEDGQGGTHRLLLLLVMMLLASGFNGFVLATLVGHMATIESIPRIIYNSGP